MTMLVTPTGSSPQDGTTPPITTQPLPGSRKTYVAGRLPGVRVPMREIETSPTRTPQGEASLKETVVVYDTSGPYTDPTAKIDVRRGLAPLRRQWILDRGDVEELPDLTSQFGRARAQDPKLASLRFQHIRRPLRAKAGANVTQLHYARKGIITPEMEFIAIRENLRREQAAAHGATNGNGNGRAGGVPVCRPDPLLRRDGRGRWRDARAGADAVGLARRGDHRGPEPAPTLRLRRDLPDGRR